MTEELRSILLGTAGLSAAAAVALFLTLARGTAGSQTQLLGAVRLGMATVLFQAAHFGEEWATGFHRRFPELLGLTPWSLRFFVTFNVVWLAVWLVSLRGLGARRRMALFPLWFLGLGGIANGAAHPLLSLRTGDYFPGLVTSPFVGIAGVLLLRSLWAVTGPSPGDRRT